MKHFGDIKIINGAAVPFVDIITGGSPCQDLSVAGKRAGLDGERSGLFMEQIRIIKEMRNATRKQAEKQFTTANDIRRYTRPRYMVWENVLGAFSSNEGEDFRVVLEETARVADPAAVIPRLEKGKKWAHAGIILGDGWSIAWRVHDAQFWGVPQRRKRVALVADFGGQSAPEILFECEIMRRDPAACEGKGKDIAARSGGSIVEAITFQERTGKAGGGKGLLNQGDHAGALDTFNKQFALIETVCLEGNGSRPSHLGDGYVKSDFSYTLNTTERHGVAYNQDRVAVVRRLTPLECERLQGFPDGWTDLGEWTDSKGKQHKYSDAPRYKALGNSIALPFWQWLAHNIVAQYGGTACSMASLFDGIGGFPLVFSRANCVPIWASEIEEFPIAVTKYHFPETI